jgi:predicted nucleic acid-binding protein
MSFVADCSMAMAWILKDETTPATDKVLDLLGHGDSAWVPALWRWEVSNVLLLAERRKRVTKAEVNSHLSLLGALPIEHDEVAVSQAWNATHALAQKHKLTSYDAAYLELAVRRGLPLASLDTELRAAAKAEKVELLPERV